MMNIKRHQYSLAVLMALSAGASVAADFGAPLSPPITVASLTVQPRGTAVARDASGNFVVSWLPSSLDSYVSVAQKFAADGTPLTGVIPVSGYGTGSIAMDDAGDFVVVGGYFEYVEDNTRGQKVVAQVFAPDGTPLTAFITVAEFGRGVSGTGNSDGAYVTSTDLGGVRVSMSGSGDFVVAWGGSISYGNTPNGLRDAYESLFVQSRRYHLDGTPYGDAVTLDHQSGRGFVYSAPEITGMGMNATGDYAITWNRNWGTSNSNCHARFYAADGTPTSPNISLPSSIKPQSKDVHNVSCSDSIAVTSSGDVIFLWEAVNDTANPTTEIDYIGRYSSRGQLKTQPTPILTRSYVYGPQSLFGFGGLTIGATSANGSVVSWGLLGDIPYSTGEYPMTTYAQAYDSNDQPVGDTATLTNLTVSAQGVIDNPAMLATVLDANDNLIVVDGQVTAQRFQGPVAAPAAAVKTR